MPLLPAQQLLLPRLIGVGRLYVPPVFSLTRSSTGVREGRGGYFLLFLAFCAPLSVGARFFGWLRVVYRFFRDSAQLMPHMEQLMRGVGVYGSSCVGV